mmetsp:Transcript_59464/g.150875  ORF Transcript_59464/g.150875 Transcript_59464/m.150875 type:complete len:240 (-) Transcript_59464:427-1146(-)
MTLSTSPMYVARRPLVSQTRIRSCTRSLSKRAILYSSCPKSAMSPSLAQEIPRAEQSLVTSSMGKRDHNATSLKSWASSSRAISLSAGRPIPEYHLTRSSLDIWCSTCMCSATRSAAILMSPIRRASYPRASQNSMRLCSKSLSMSLSRLSSMLQFDDVASSTSMLKLRHSFSNSCRGNACQICTNFIRLHNSSFPISFSAGKPNPSYQASNLSKAILSICAEVSTNLRTVYTSPIRLA